MMKKSVFELAARYVHPSIRRLLVETLHAKGLTITEINRLLGVSPSSVTRYLKGERGVVIDLADNPAVVDKINKLAMEIIEEKPGQYVVEEKLVKITISVIASKYLCKYHKKIEPGIDVEKCNICPRVFGKYAA